MRTIPSVKIFYVECVKKEAKKTIELNVLMDSVLSVGVMTESVRVSRE